MEKKKYNIPTDNKIKSFVHCGLCIKEKPPGISPRDYASLEVGFTKIGLQVWCKRHECNVMHIDFEGQRHPANSTIPNIPKIEREGVKCAEGCDCEGD